MKLKKSLKSFEVEFSRKKNKHTQVKTKLQKCEQKLSELGKSETTIELALRKSSESRKRALQEVSLRLHDIQFLVMDRCAGHAQFHSSCVLLGGRR